MKQQWCRCGHHRIKHASPDTSCVTWKYDGTVNALGIKGIMACPCPSWRPTSRTWWQVHFTQGTEES